ncbi:MAG TPA: exosortase system-associated protein, TIGR04073 family [Verrucomicrobiae bacterium]|nr:exosortase system-associated protein, TIGR04073 family [Verrucomicrobiae bacterium]
MRNAMAFLTVVALVALLTSGCAGPEQKLGRGMNNFYEVVRMGEMRRSIEQTAVLESPDAGYTLGAIHGIDRSLARTGLGVVEVVTFPFPPYHPIFTRYLAADAVYPESYKPGMLSDALFDTDTYTGFTGGDVAPFIPGSRFRIFDN